MHHALTKYFYIRDQFIIIGVVVAAVMVVVRYSLFDEKNFYNGITLNWKVIQGRYL